MTTGTSGGHSPGLYTIKQSIPLSEGDAFFVGIQRIICRSFWRSIFMLAVWGISSRRT